MKFKDSMGNLKDKLEDGWSFNGKIQVEGGAKTEYNLKVS